MQAVRDAGLAGIAVEPLAARLGATKGSFYWHFRDREALIAAVLDRWEHTETDDVIASLPDGLDPAQRLNQLMELTWVQPRPPDLSVVLLPDAEHPLVAAALERVTRRRVDFLAEECRALGVGPAEARQRAVLAYAAYLGIAQLRRHLPAFAPHGSDALPYITLMQCVIAPHSMGRETDADNAA